VPTVSDPVRWNRYRPTNKRLRTTRAPEYVSNALRDRNGAIGNRRVIVHYSPGTTDSYYRYARRTGWSDRTRGIRYARLFRSFVHPPIQHPIQHLSTIRNSFTAPEHKIDAPRTVVLLLFPNIENRERSDRRLFHTREPPPRSVRATRGYSTPFRVVDVLRSGTYLRRAWVQFLF